MSGSTSSNYIPRATSPLGQPWTPLQEEEVDPLSTIVAPVPQYATPSGSPSSKPLTLYTTNRSMQSGGIEQRLEEQQQQQQLLAMRPPSTSKQLDFQDYSDVLPKLGKSQDAQAALDKLDRLAKINAQKRKWPKLKSGNKVGQAPHPKKEDDDDSITSSLNLYEEVRMAISSMPGFTGFTKSRQAFDSSDRPDSTHAGGITNDESVNSDRGNLPFRFGSQRRRSTAPSPGPDSLQSTVDHNLVKAQTDVVPTVPANPGISSPKSGVGASTDLMPLKEERKIEEATDVLTADSVPTIKPTLQLVKPKPERPRLMIQSPTVTGTEVMQSPENITPQQNALIDFLQKERERHSGSPLRSVTPTSINQTPSPGPCDADAVKAAEQARKDLSRPSMFDEAVLDDLAASIGSPSSIGSGSGSDESDLSSEEETEDQIRSLNLEHGEELTRKQKKKLLRNLKRARRKQIAKGGGMGEETVIGEGELGPAAIISKRHKRTASLTNHISTGLHYASSQSRNRRAMEKYSPHPSRPASAKPFSNNPALSMSQMGTPPFGPTQMNGSISRSSTPANALGSERSSMSNDDGNKDATGLDSRPTSVRNGMLNGGVQSPEESTEDDVQRSFDVSRNLLKRWATNNSTTSTLMPSGSIKGPSFKNRLLSLRRGARQQPSDVMEEDPDHTPQQEDAEKELDRALGKLVAEEAPEELGEHFEYDVLYENQRGMLFFGIPKFSSKTLFQWDPAPWTNSRNKDSAYNVVNAQLPNPSWEWVHPEWMIDMSGDVDESGWQYSYNFGRFNFNVFNRPTQIIPRANAEGNAITNERFNKTVQDMEKSAERNREDDGFEALKRSAITRQAKWSGIPTQNTYVRRRRWIRLRRRRPLDVAQHISQTPKADTPMGMSRASNDWSQLIKSDTTSSQGLDKKAKVENGASPVIKGDDEDDSLSNFEEGSSGSSSSSASSSEMEDANLQGESAFMARRTTGDLKSGRDPTESRATKEQLRRKRHAKEFTGSIRELKSLLPSILDRRGGRSHRSTTTSGKTANDRQKSLWLMEIDARNPFISWSFVKRRLEDDDLAFASTSIRARERRYAQRQLEKRARSEKRKSSTISIASGPVWEQFELTRDALIEINYRRVCRVLKACKLDRQKIQLWKVWLNVDPLNAQIEPSRNEDLIELGLAASSAAASESLIRAKEELAKLAKTRWRAAFTPADAIDVWDVIERRLDRLLLTFEYQHGRAQFLRMLLTIHATSHPNHRFKPGQVKVGGSAVPGSEAAVEPDAPAVLSPTGGASVAGDEWRVARVPRLEFWSDLIDCARGLVGSGSATSQAGGKLSSSNSREMIQFLQLPAHKQHDVLVQTRSSVFKDKIHSQTAEDHRPHMEESVGSPASAGRRASVMSSRSIVASPPPISHDRTDSEVVRRLAQAIGDD
ncbi:uncharacterized protein FA14DRAFT_160367 [Meira miltonrushii]|uniref:Peroxin/Ferlin domain-containing protein n=1 Tax=Meira miltonrushii TaxID=1280837 RepID=A0A316VFD2_9BASI|nr:uncharacterized protein FA14DRAFT_160367 [Meira miltonrushii]PWN35023.1 hypothetical protein FA14DRAFT_160367 [Meira miltonrushii]